MLSEENYKSLKCTLLIVYFKVIIRIFSGQEDRGGAAIATTTDESQGTGQTTNHNTPGNITFE